MDIIAPINFEILRGDFDFGVLIKPTHPGGHPNIWILALSPKLWVWQSLLSFKPENSDFGLLDKIGPSYKGVKDKNKSYHGTLFYWVKVIYKKQKIWNWKFFLMKIWWFSSKYQGQEKLLALTRPLPQRVPMDNFGKK